MIILYGSGQSRSFRTLWALEESGLEYHYEAVRIGRRGESGTQSTRYKELNYQGKVPSLKDDDNVINETTAILNYIAALSPDKELIPTNNLILRANYDEICSFVITELEQALWTQAKHQFLLPKEYRITDIYNTVEWELNKAFDTLSHYLADKNYIVGDQFTMADILIAHTLAWAELSEFKIPTQLLNYKNKHFERPALKRSFKIIEN